MVNLSDLMLRELANVQMTPSNQYNWHILTQLNEADKLVYGFVDKLSGHDQNLKLAMRKLRVRAVQASEVTQKTVTKLQAKDTEKIEALKKIT